MDLNLARLRTENETEIGDVKKKLYPFSLYEPDGTVLTFGADTPEVREGWVDILNQTVESKTKLVCYLFCY